jgi:hypothetical protein
LQSEIPRRLRLLGMTSWTIFFGGLRLACPDPANLVDILLAPQDNGSYRVLPGFNLFGTRAIALGLSASDLARAAERSNSAPGQRSTCFVKTHSGIHPHLAQ